ncbi:hypothetical protein D3C81_169950 [compost metagenome]
MHAQHAAKEKLFGANGLGALNFKMFPGHSRETTPEQVAEQILQAIAMIETGEVVAFEDFED